MKVKQMAKVVMKFVDENLPLILTIAAECGLVATVVSAVHDAPKAKDAISETKDEKAKELQETSDRVLVVENVKLNAWEYFKCLAPVYWRTAVCATGTGLCIFFAYHTQHKRYLAALGLLALREKDLEKYKNKVKELFGESKAEKVENELANDIIQMAPMEDENTFFTMYGNQLFYDTASHSWFRSNLNAVKKGINDFNAQLMHDKEASVDDLCYHYGFEQMAEAGLSRNIWTYDDNKENQLVPKFRFSGHPVTQEACTVITYDRLPVYHQ